MKPDERLHVSYNKEKKMKLAIQVFICIEHVGGSSLYSYMSNPLPLGAATVLVYRKAIQNYKQK